MHRSKAVAALACAVALGALACEREAALQAGGAPPGGACELHIAPASLAFSTPVLDSPIAQSLTLQNLGLANCAISQFALDPDSDSGFALSPLDPSDFTLVPQASASASVTFSAQSRATPSSRTGSLTVMSNDPVHPSQSVPLVATLDTGCQLSIAPDPLDFGNVALNQLQTQALAITNQGTMACSLSGLALAPGTDGDFALPAGQGAAFNLQPGDGISIPVSFDAASAPPNLHTGAIDFTVSSSEQPDPVATSVGLEAYIDTDCTAAAALFYVLDESGVLSSFDPDTLAFTPIGQLACATSAAVFDMAIDQHAAAWVEYGSGELFKVDTSNASCSATGFAPDQEGISVFGMAFLFDPSAGTDTLYIAGGDDSAAPSELATISFPSLTVHPVGEFPLGFAELAGTGDGQLWAFVPQFESLSGVATLAQINPATGAALQAWTYPQIQAEGAWTMKFFGGSFWIFIGSSLYSVSRDTAALTLALDGTGPGIVGAGVSTCAPLRPGRVAKSLP